MHDRNSFPNAVSKMATDLSEREFDSTNQTYMFTVSIKAKQISQSLDSSPTHRLHLVAYLHGMMQGQIPFQKHSFLFTAGESAGDPGGEGAAQDAQAGQAEEDQVQRVQAVRPFHHCTHKLDVENSPNKSTDATG